MLPESGWSIGLTCNSTLVLRITQSRANRTQAVVFGSGDTTPTNITADEADKIIASAKVHRASSVNQYLLTTIPRICLMTLQMMTHTSLPTISSHWLPTADGNAPLCSVLHTMQRRPDTPLSYWRMGMRYVTVWWALILAFHAITTTLSCIHPGLLSLRSILVSSINGEILLHHHFTRYSLHHSAGLWLVIWTSLAFLLLQLVDMHSPKNWFQVAFCYSTVNSPHHRRLERSTQRSFIIMPCPSWKKHCDMCILKLTLMLSLETSTRLCTSTHFLQSMIGVATVSAN